MDLNPYPLYYCPDGVGKPVHCPHHHMLRTVPGAGPDGGAGIVYGPVYDIESKPRWQKTAAGWWVLLDGKLPQHLVKFDRNPRIMRWHTIEGAEPTQFWQVPVLLTPINPDDLAATAGYMTAVDRVYIGAAGANAAGDWMSPPEIAEVQEKLLAITQHIALADDVELRNAAVTRLVLRLLAFGHLVSEGEIAVGGWLSELMQYRVIFAAIDRLDLADNLTAAAAGRHDAV